MTETEAREEICRVGKSLFERGYVHASAGNISVRLDDEVGGGFLITPTDACLGFLFPEKLAKMDAKAQQVSGDKASKTFALHRQIYAASRLLDPNTSCIIHTHSMHCVALSLNCADAELLPALTPYFVMKVGHVPLIPYHRPGDPVVGTVVAQTIQRYGAAGKPLRAAMLQRLGPNVWHDSPAQAMATLEELEETAKLWLMAQPKPPALNTVQIDELRHAFGARW